ncbi:MAG TPA: hypothetical protein VHF51_16920 [Solirubrobacteraceae bacterium]|nr:hypothetical protein [Solirubrobacteraceae bacterium]
MRCTSPEEMIEGGAASHRVPSRRAEHRLELGSVLVLSLAVLATAWSGYHAARWSGEESRLYTEASGLRVKSAQEATIAGQARIDDLLYFNGWLEAYDSGNRELAAVYRRRLRPEFRPVFRAWIAQRPFTNPRAIPGPLYMPQYRPAALDRAAALDEEAEELYREGAEAKGHDDGYILSTVFFAAVLFFASMSLRLEWWKLRVAVFGLATAMLLLGVVWVLSLPIA